MSRPKVEDQKRKRPIEWTILTEPRPLSCTKCRRAHRNCDGGKPCERCVRTGNSEHCYSTFFRL